MRSSDVQRMIDMAIENRKTGANVMSGDGGYQVVPLSELKPGRYEHLSDEEMWFVIRGHWIIRKVPNTKNDFYVACGHPPANVLKIYGIKL
jgi:hypothetical protein